MHLEFSVTKDCQKSPCIIARTWRLPFSADPKLELNWDAVWSSRLDFKQIVGLWMQAVFFMVSLSVSSLLSVTIFPHRFEFANHIHTYNLALTLRCLLLSFMLRWASSIHGFLCSNWNHYNNDDLAAFYFPKHHMSEEIHWLLYTKNLIEPCVLKLVFPLQWSKHSVSALLPFHSIIDFIW